MIKKIRARSVTFSIFFAVMGAVHGPTTTWTSANAANAVMFPDQRFQHTETPFYVGKGNIILKHVFSPYVLLWQPYLSSTVNPIAPALTVQTHSLLLTVKNI